MQLGEINFGYIYIIVVVYKNQTLVEFLFKSVISIRKHSWKTDELFHQLFVKKNIKF